MPGRLPPDKSLILNGANYAGQGRYEAFGILGAARNRSFLNLTMVISRRSFMSSAAVPPVESVGTARANQILPLPIGPELPRWEPGSGLAPLFAGGWRLARTSALNCIDWRVGLVYRLS